MVYNIILYSNTPITAVALGGVGASISVPWDQRAQKRDRKSKGFVIDKVGAKLKL